MTRGGIIRNVIQRIDGFLLRNGELFVRDLKVKKEVYVDET